MIDLQKLRDSIPPMSEECKAMIAAYDDGRTTGLAGGADDETKPRNWRSGWISGCVRRKASAGTAIVVMMAGTRCKTCESVTWGHRMGCRCNGNIEWGVLAMARVFGEPASFQTWDELRAAKAAGTTVINGDTGEDLCLTEDAAASDCETQAGALDQEQALRERQAAFGAECMELGKIEAINAKGNK